MLWLIPVTLWSHLLSSPRHSSLLHMNHNHLMLVAGAKRRFPSNGITPSARYRAYESSNINAFSGLAHAPADNWILSLRAGQTPEGQWQHPVSIAQLFSKLAFAHAKYDILAPSLKVLSLTKSMGSKKWNKAHDTPGLSKLLNITAQVNGIVLPVAAYENRPSEYTPVVRFLSTIIRKKFPHVAIIAELPVPDSSGFWNVSQQSWLKDIQTTRHLVDGYALFQSRPDYSSYSWTSPSLIISGIRVADETKQLSSQSNA
jgi:hypothetical protein